MSRKQIKCAFCDACGHDLLQDYKRVTAKCECEVHRDYRTSECLRCGTHNSGCPACDREEIAFHKRIQEAEADPRNASGKYVGWVNRNKQLQVLNGPTKSYIYRSSPEADILFSIGWDGRIVATWENTASGKAFAEDDMWFGAGYDTHPA
jgi:hypothetical protein